MPTLKTYDTDGQMARQEQILITNVKRQRHVFNAGIDDSAQLASLLKASNNLSDEQVLAGYQELAGIGSEEKQKTKR